MSTVARTRPSSRTHRHQRRPAIIGILIAALTGAVSLGVTLCPGGRSAALARSATAFTPLPVGAQAPRLELADAGAGNASAAFPAAGEVTLVSFLATQPDTANTPSRSQAVALVSLHSQYSAKGLHAVIVDESPAATKQDALTNTLYDWQLGQIPLLADPGHAAASRYGVTDAPTTLLISRSGTVLARWNGYVLTATATQAITPALAQDAPAGS